MGVGRAVYASVRDDLIMPLLPFDAVNFHPAPRATSPLRVPSRDVAWAAVTLGKPPLMAAAPRRSLAEMSWRVNIVRANLDVGSGWWIKSNDYRRLDRSEKIAVSYFLGMMQAKVTSRAVLGVPYLVHLDLVLELMGAPTGVSRPDFLGCDIFGRVLPVAIEAKGRTHGWDARLRWDAKGQAARIPSILGLTDPTAVASIAWFDQDDRWQSLLEDPVRAERVTQAVELPILLYAYYWPIVRAFVEAGIQVNRRLQLDASVKLELPDADLTVTLPAGIVKAIGAGTSDGLPSLGEIRARAASLLGILDDLGALRRDAQESGESAADFIGIRLGPTWVWDANETSSM